MDKELTFMKFRQYRKLYQDINKIIDIVESKIGNDLFLNPMALIQSQFIHTLVFTDDDVRNECKKIADKNEHIKMVDSVRDTISIQMIAPEAENTEDPIYDNLSIMRLTDLYWMRNILGKAIEELMAG